MKAERRTTIDLSEMQLIVNKSERISIYEFKLPKGSQSQATFIVGLDITAVTGDWGNWIFDTEFHPKKDGYVSDGYWLEKLRRNSCQEPTVFDSSFCEQQIKELLDSQESVLTNEEGEFLYGLQGAIISEQAYNNFVFANKDMWSGTYEDLPTGRKVRRHLPILFDMFDEMCERIAALDEAYDEFKENPDRDVNL